MTVAVRLAAAAKDLAVAGVFGTSREVDAFLIALLLPMAVVNILAGSFGAALMPTLIQVREQKGDRAARRVFASSLTLGILVLIVATGALALLGPLLLPVLGSGFEPETLSLTRSLLSWLVPIAALTGLSRLLGTAINAEERFAIVAAAPAMTPICAVAALLGFGHRFGIYALAVGTLIGAGLELVILLAVVARSRLSVVPRWGGLDEHVQSVVHQYAPMVAGSVLMSGTVIVDQSMAAMLQPGSVAALTYGSRIVTLILGLVALSLGTVVLPHYSRMVAAEDWQGVRETFGDFTRLVLLVTVPITVLLIAFSHETIELVFQRGAFDDGDAALVSRIQGYYALQIPFYVMGTLSVRLFSALRANQILLAGAAISLPLNVALNVLFVRWLGVAGIALSTSVVYAASLVFLLTMLAVRLRAVRT